MLIYKYDDNVWNEANRLAYEWWAASKRGTYGSGIINCDDDKAKAQRVGILAQIAFSHFSGLSADLSYKEYGDQYDFISGGKTIDIKASHKNYGKSFIKCLHDNGTNAFRNYDYYVGAITWEDKKEVHLLGYQTGLFISKLPIKKSPVKSCSHSNFELLHRDLIPIEDFLKNLKQPLRNRV